MIAIFVSDGVFFALLKKKYEQNSHMFKWKQMLQRDSNFIKIVITDDESWVNHYDFLLKSEVNIWKHTNFSSPTKIRQTKHAVMVMIFSFFVHKCVGCQHAVHPKYTVKVEHYISV